MSLFLKRDSTSSNRTLMRWVCEEGRKRERKVRRPGAELDDVFNCLQDLISLFMKETAALIEKIFNPVLYFQHKTREF